MKLYTCEMCKKQKHAWGIAHKSNDNWKITMCKRCQQKTKTSHDAQKLRNQKTEKQHKKELIHMIMNAIEAQRRV